MSSEEIQTPNLPCIEHDKVDLLAITQPPTESEVVPDVKPTTSGVERLVFTVQEQQAEEEERVRGSKRPAALGSEQTFNFNLVKKARIVTRIVPARQSFKEQQAKGKERVQGSERQAALGSKQKIMFRVLKSVTDPQITKKLILLRDDHVNDKDCYLTANKIIKYALKHLQDFSKRGVNELYCVLEKSVLQSVADVNKIDPISSRVEQFKLQALLHLEMLWTFGYSSASRANEFHYRMWITRREHHIEEATKMIQEIYTLSRETMANFMKETIIPNYAETLGKVLVEIYTTIEHPLPKVLWVISLNDGSDNVSYDASVIAEEMIYLRDGDRKEDCYTIVQIMISLVLKHIKNISETGVEELSNVLEHDVFQSEDDINQNYAFYARVKQFKLQVLLHLEVLWYIGYCSASEGYDEDREMINFMRKEHHMWQVILWLQAIEYTFNSTTMANFFNKTIVNNYAETLAEILVAICEELDYPIPEVLRTMTVDKGSFVEPFLNSMITDKLILLRDVDATPLNYYSITQEMISKIFENVKNVGENRVEVLYTVLENGVLQPVPNICQKYPLHCRLKQFQIQVLLHLEVLVSIGSCSALVEHDEEKQARYNTRSQHHLWEAVKQLRGIIRTYNRAILAKFMTEIVFDNYAEKLGEVLVEIFNSVNQPIPDVLRVISWDKDSTFQSVDKSVITDKLIILRDAHATPMNCYSITQEMINVIFEHVKNVGEHRAEVLYAVLENGVLQPVADICKKYPSQFLLEQFQIQVLLRLEVLLSIALVEHDEEKLRRYSTRRQHNIWEAVKQLRAIAATNNQATMAKFMTEIIVENYAEKLGEVLVDIFNTVKEPIPDVLRVISWDKGSTSQSVDKSVAIGSGNSIADFLKDLEIEKPSKKKRKKPKRRGSLENGEPQPPQPSEPPKYREYPELPPRILRLSKETTTQRADLTETTTQRADLTETTTQRAQEYAEAEARMNPWKKSRLEVNEEFMKVQAKLGPRKLHPVSTVPQTNSFSLDAQPGTSRDTTAC